MDSVQQQLADFGVMLLELMLPVIIAWATVKMHQLIDAAKAKYAATTTAEDRKTIESIVQMAVFAAEQTGLTLKARGMVLDKKQEALNVAHAALAARGINVDFNELDAQVEATVLASFNDYKVEDAVQEQKDAPSPTMGFALGAE